MRTTVFVSLLLLLILPLGLTSTAGAVDSALKCPGLKAGAKPAECSGILAIKTDEPGRPISQMLYGVFYEDINYGADGGLYAELVRNRSFEHLRKLEGWQRINEQDQAKIVIESESPLNENNRHYVKLVSYEAGKDLGVINQGYDGMAISRGKDYEFTIYARSEDSLDGELLVSLIDRDGMVYGEGSIGGITPEWQKYSLQIKAMETCHEARLMVRINQPGTVCLDMISLFPTDTWQGRANGLRKDLVEMLAELRPAFIRFPGGCIVEGNGMINAYRWKDTIGDVALRKTNSNLWGYYQSYGLGFYEYFHLCEDLGAKPVPIVNAGMSCQVRGGQYVPVEELDDWVQDALDLIEYANGPADSPWGSNRAASGHPEPFNLEYLGIGNENWGPEYHERYEIFHRAIKERYPEIKLIAGSGVAYTGPDYQLAKRWAERVGVDVFDEHMYWPPQWFYENVDRYDNYARGDMQIFVGEYAAHGEGRRNNLEAALAEAAFMIGLERNSDLVHMASYAPLFNKVGSSQWVPDLIWFDNTDCYGTPSYYVQRMFSNNLGDTVLPHEYQGRIIASHAEPNTGTRDQMENGNLYVGCSRDYDTGDVIIKVVNRLGLAQTVEIRLEGDFAVSGQGRAEVLASSDLRDENSFARPKKVAPVLRKLTGLGSSFCYTFDAYSVAVIRIGQQGRVLAISAP